MISRTLIACGASKVYILGRRLSTLTSASTANPGLIPIQCDITSKESLQAAVNHITRDAGYINLLVANSGILGPTAMFNLTQTVHEMRENMFVNTTMSDFTNTFEVNSTATYFTLLAFLELLDAGNKHAVESGGFGKPIKKESKVPAIQSQVLVTSSVGAYLRDQTCAPAYMASKSALIAMVKHAASGLAGVGIRVNALAPGCEYHYVLLPSSFFAAADSWAISLPLGNGGPTHRQSRPRDGSGGRSSLHSCAQVRRRRGDGWHGGVFGE
jgi:NAD(P)-dependent dehydrogenase (short-subunit alcohol dehydrogenase family)